MGRPALEAEEIAADVLAGIPVLSEDSDIRQVKAFIAAVTNALMAGAIKPGIAREAGQLASKQITAIRTESGMHEMDELRDLVRRMEAALAESKGREVAGRYGQGEEGLIGDWSDGKK
jgi:hypothetical protein